MPSDSKFTRDDDGNIAVRVISNTGVSEQPESMFTKDEDGNVAVRVVFGSGGGGGDSHNKGFFATPQALQEAYPTADAGDFAIVNSTDTVWIWDVDTSAWKDGDTKGQVTSVNNQTGAVVLDASDVGALAQVSTLPTASATEEDKIYQFIGTTDANYTNGYFYKCVSDGQNPATYSWVRQDVQPAPEALPSQTGNAGKVLVTDGTDASWGGSIESLDFAYQSSWINHIGYRGVNGYICFGVLDSDKDYLRFGWDGNNSALLSEVSGSTLGTSNAKWTNVYTTTINNGADITVPSSGGTMIVNTATASNALTVGGVAADSIQAVNVGVSSKGDSAYVTNIGYKAVSGALGTAIGHEAKADGSTISGGSIAIGASAQAEKDMAVAIGNSSHIYGYGTYSICLGYLSRTASTGTIVFNASGRNETIQDANTFYILNANGTYKVMDANGTIPTARLTKVNSTITLTAAGWSSNTQTVNVTGMTANGVVMVSPDPTDQADYISAGIICSAQAAGTLTFTCDSTPANDIDVVVVML